MDAEGRPDLDAPRLLPLPLAVVITLALSQVSEIVLFLTVHRQYEMPDMDRPVYQIAVFGNQTRWPPQAGGCQRMHTSLRISGFSIAKRKSPRAGSSFGC